MKKLGFGFMRLPMRGEEVDIATLCKMVDCFMARGFHYFDTAHGYVSGKSEAAIRAAVSSRYPREQFILTDKLTTNFFHKQEDIAPFVQSQLEACGVTYFDYYLMHALNADYYKKYTKCCAFEEVEKLKNAGKIKHMGISFHDKADVLDMILTEHPEIEVVQLQFNYVDYNDASIEGRKCYEVCVKHQKPVIVMEPIKGGALANLPDTAKKVLDELGSNLSYASYAVRFAASFDQIIMVLSGMSDMEQLEDNTSYMQDFAPFTEKEYQAVEQVAEILKGSGTIACTGCHYCTDGCPKKIAIPKLFSCYNAKKMFNDWNSDWYYSVYTKEDGKASDCIECKQCEKICPQHLPIIKLLKTTAKTFE